MQRLLTACRNSSRWIATFLASLLFLMSATSFALVTAEGKHCPTAPVQLVVETPITPTAANQKSKIKNQKSLPSCCAAKVRAPKLGDKAFVQCRCAEKKSVEQKAALQTRIEFFQAPQSDLPICAALPPVFHGHRLLTPWYRSVPLLLDHPPQAA